jgi:hypothetical protein
MPQTNLRAAAQVARSAEPGYIAIISLGGSRLVFDSAAGEDLGAYEGEYVRQRCIRVMRDDSPLTVYFRPDVGLARLEVVVELGRVWLDGTGFQPAHIATPYTCEIQYRGRTIATVNVPYHWWWARWRWQSAPRPIVRSPAVLLQKRLIVPYGQSGLYGGEHAREAEWSGPMSTAGIYTYMPGVGDRPDIGLVTEIQGQYLVNGSSAALSSLLAQGEACGTMPIHWRDEHTGAIIDAFQYPRMSADELGKPRLPTLRPPRLTGPHSGLDQRYIVYDTSHAPAASFLPFVLTDDPFLLEELEAQGTFAIMQHTWFRNLYHLPGLVHPGQPRGFGWGIRSLFQLGVVAPEKPPRWLKERDYWRRCLADNLTLARLYMQSPARVHRIFRAFTVSSKIYPWQNSYVAVVLGTGVWMGYTEWRDFYYWFCNGITQMCDGKSGWNQEWPTPYKYYPIRPHRDALHLVPDRSRDGQTAASWGEMWAWFKEDNKLDSALNGGPFMPKLHGPAYLLYLRGCLALMTHLGVPGAKKYYDYIAGQVPGWLARTHHHGNCRWSIDPA